MARSTVAADSGVGGGVGVSVAFGLMITSEFMAEHMRVQFSGGDGLNMSHNSRDHRVKVFQAGKEM
jgi:hypothetical protein